MPYVMLHINGIILMSNDSSERGTFCKNNNRNYEWNPVGVEKNMNKIKREIFELKEAEIFVGWKKIHREM